MFLAKGLHTAFVQEGLDCLGLCKSDLEEKSRFHLVVERTLVPPDAHPARTGPPGDFGGHARGFSHGAPLVGEGLYLFVGVSERFDLDHRRWYTWWRHAHISIIFPETVRATAPQTSTMTSIIEASALGVRETIQTSSTYSIPHTTGRT